VRYQIFYITLHHTLYEGYSFSVSDFDCVDKKQWLVILHKLLQHTRPADHRICSLLHIVWHSSNSECREIIAEHIWRARQACQSCWSWILADGV